MTLHTSFRHPQSHPTPHPQFTPRSGYFINSSGELRDPLNQPGDNLGDGWGVDVFPLSTDEFSYALGQRGETRKKLARAADCIMEYVGFVAVMGGFKDERSRAKDYLEWLLKQRKGALTVETRGRDDLTIVEVPRGSVGFVTGHKGESLRDVERQTGTFCFADGEKGATSNAGEYEKLLIFGASSEARYLRVCCFLRCVSVVPFVFVCFACVRPWLLCEADGVSSCVVLCFASARAAATPAGSSRTRSRSRSPATPAAATADTTTAAAADTTTGGAAGMTTAAAGMTTAAAAAGATEAEAGTAAAAGGTAAAGTATAGTEAAGGTARAAASAAAAAAGAATAAERRARQHGGDDYHVGCC